MGFFKQVTASFSNFSIYHDIAFQKTGKTIKYFLLLFTLVFFLGSLRLAYEFNLSATDMLKTVQDKIPEFNLANGELHVKGTQPIILTGENNTALIIDTTGKTNETVLDNYNEGVFIARYELFTKQDFQVKKISFGSFKGLTLDKQKLIQWLPVLKWLFLVVGVIGYLFSIVWVLITTALLAIAGSAMVKVNLRNKIKYGNVWNIAVYAMTLPWLMEMLEKLAYPGLPLFWVIKWGTALFITYKAIQAVSNELTEEVI